MPREVSAITEPDSEAKIRQAVRERYAELALRNECCGDDRCSDSTCGVSQESPVPEEAAQIAAGCGSPLAHTAIAQGEILVDLGSGGGIDVFRASSLVGRRGRVVGIDATPEMIWRARRTAGKNGYENVEFRLGEIEHIPLESDFADCVISNCVVNLAPDKEAVFREAFRILRPGGRLVVSDIVAEEPVPPEARDHMTGWAECLTGAIPEIEYLRDLSNAGFIKAQVLERTPLRLKHVEDSVTQKLKLASLTIFASKPERERT